MGKEITPKEKAKELVDKMYDIEQNPDGGITQYEAKQCALIAVGEMIKESEAIIEIVRPHSEMACWPIAERIRDLIIMKQEVENL